MTILLDIDGVLVTTPPWQATEQQEDGFLKFNEKAAKNLARIIEETKAGIVLTTSHRINYSVDEWKGLLKTRGISPSSISKINEATSLKTIADRATEIKEWAENRTNNESFVIIDDDLKLNSLPLPIKLKWVMTKPMIGLDEEATTKILEILLGK